MVYLPDGSSEMRYWQHNETGRLLKIDIQMAPRNWTQITKEQYEEAHVETSAEFLIKVDKETENVKSGFYPKP